MNKKVLLCLVPFLLITLVGCSGSKKASSPSSSELPPSSSEVPVDNKIIIDFDLNGGSSPSYHGPIEVESFDTSVFFFDVTKANWNFRGWEYNGVKIFDEKGHQLANPTITSSMTFKAIFSQTVKLSIVKNIDAAGTISGDGEYAYNTNVGIKALVNDGYQFEGWYVNGNLIANKEDYNFRMWSEDVTIEARFIYLKHELLVKSNNALKGTVMIQKESHISYGESDVEDIVYQEQVTIVANTFKDTRFLGWFDEDGELVDTNAVYTFVMPDKDVAYTAKWNYFTIEYVLNDGTNDERNVDHYSLDKSSFNLFAPERAGYTFGGWKVVFENGYRCIGPDNIPIATSFMEDLKFIANWVENVGNLYLSSNDDSMGTFEMVSGVGEPSTNVTVRATPRDGYVFKGWYNKTTQKMVAGAPEYTHTMPSSGNLYLEAQFMSLEEVGAKPVKHGKTITYGLYPKNKVTDTSLIALLNDNGGLHQSNDYYYLNLNFYRHEADEYFKCEPVEWICMDATNRVYISKYILDASSYYSLEAAYPTRYAFSSLATMFSAIISYQLFGFGQEYVLNDVTVNNAADTTDSEENKYSPKPGDTGYSMPYQCLYAPSYQDLRDNNLGFSSNPNATKTRKALTTEYAIARGLVSNSYWTRSPVSSTTTESEVWAVDYDGKLVATSVEAKRGDRPVVQFSSAIDAL